MKILETTFLGEEREIMVSLSPPLPPLFLSLQYDLSPPSPLMQHPKD